MPGGKVLKGAFERAGYGHRSRELGFFRKPGKQLPERSHRNAAGFRQHFIGDSFFLFIALTRSEKFMDGAPFYKFG